MSKPKKSSNKLEKAVDAIVTRIEKAESFALEQAPDVCKEVIREKVALGYYSAVVELGVTSGLIKLAFFLASFYDQYERAEWPAITATIAGLAAVIMGIITLCEVGTLISVKAAPKLTILRELKKLITKESDSK